MTDAIFIRKYPLPVRGACRLPDAPVLAVAFQNGIPHVWLETPDTMGIVPTREFWVVFTGEHFKTGGMEHVGSCVSDSLVCHVYAERAE